MDGWVLRHFEHASSGHIMPENSLKFISKANGVYKRKGECYGKDL